MVEIVRNPYPLQQGLRLRSGEVMDFIDPVRNPYPLQQGLRLNVLRSITCFAGGQKPISITTRIKTDKPFSKASF